jgi:hypothetical protein
VAQSLGKIITTGTLIVVEIETVTETATETGREAETIDTAIETRIVDGTGTATVTVTGIGIETATTVEEDTIVLVAAPHVLQDAVPSLHQDSKRHRHWTLQRPARRLLHLRLE